MEKTHREQYTQEPALAWTGREAWLVGRILCEQTSAIVYRQRYLFQPRENLLDIAKHAWDIAANYCPQRPYCAVDFSNANDALFMHHFYRKLYPEILKDIDNIEMNWKKGTHQLTRINCQSENSKGAHLKRCIITYSSHHLGVYCLQYDEKKIVSGLRDNTIKVWDLETKQCIKVLTGHTGSVLCLQYDNRIIISGSSDSTVR